MAKQLKGSSARLCAVLVSTVLASCGGGSDGGGSDAVMPSELAAALPDGDHILFSATGLSVTEFDRTASISVVRTGEALAAASISYRFNDGSASNGTDFQAEDGVLSWAAGESGTKQIAFDVYPDIQTETLETFDVELFDLTGGDTISGASSLSVDVVDSECEQVSGEVLVDTAWAQPCYHITSSVTFNGQAQLEIEPGTTIIANANASIRVAEEASIHLAGTSTSPVVLKGATSAVGSWGGIAITSVNPLQQINHMVIDGANIGVDLDPEAQLGSFANNTFNNTAFAALRIPTNVIDSLGSGLIFSNSPGGIRLLTKTITSSNPLTLMPQATHYSTGDSFIIDGRLTLKPGVDLRFDRDTQMYISQNGSLNAVGTEAEPIIITGVSPQPGIWNGIQWVSSSSAENHLAHVTVEYGGGDPARSGNLIVGGSDVNLRIEHSTLAHSPGYGLYQLSTGAVITMENMTYTANMLGDHFIP